MVRGESFYPLEIPYSYLTLNERCNVYNGPEILAFKSPIQVGLRRPRLTARRISHN